MKKQQLVILIFACSVVGLAGLLMQIQNKSAWESAGGKIGNELYPEFPINDISRLVIKSNASTVELSKTDDMWTVSSNFSYYADFVKIANFLKSIKNLKAAQIIEIGEDDLGRLELNDPEAENDTATRVEFYNKSNVSVAKILLGKNHMKKSEGSGGAFGGGGDWPDGRYIYEPESKLVALISETFSNVSDKNDSWIDKAFIKADKIKKATAAKAGVNLWTVYRDNETDSLTLKGKLADDEEINTGKLNGIGGALRYTSFNAVLDPAIPDEGHGFNDGTVFVAETFTGFTYTVRVGNEKNDDYPIKISMDYNEPQPTPAPEDETEEEKAKREADDVKKREDAKEKFEKESKRYTDWVFLVSSYTVDDMLLERADLIKKIEKDEESDGSELEGSGTAAQVTVPNLDDVEIKETNVTDNSDVEGIQTSAKEANAAENIDAEQESSSSEPEGSGTAPEVIVPDLDDVEIKATDVTDNSEVEGSGTSAEEAGAVPEPDLK